MWIVCTLMCVLRSLVCMWCVHARTSHRSRWGSENTCEGVRKRVRMCSHALFGFAIVFIVYYLRDDFAHFCFTVFSSVLLVFAHTRNVFFLDFCTLFFSFVCITMWTVCVCVCVCLFVCLAFRRYSVNVYNFYNVLWLSRFYLSILQNVSIIWQPLSKIIWWIICFIRLFGHFISFGFAKKKQFACGAQFRL